MDKNYKTIINYSLLFYFIISTYFLFFKSHNHADFSISDIVVNYNGGFISRALLGHIIFILHNLFDLNLITLTLTFQIFFYFIFTFLLYKILNNKNLIISKLDILIFFLPTLLFFPIYEIEALGRKEILIFISFAFLVSLKNKPSNLILLTYSFIIFPFILFTWEVAILYFSFFFLIFWFQLNAKSIKDISKILLIFLPSFFVFLFIWIYPVSEEKFDIMCKTIECIGRSKDAENFNVHFAHFDFVHDRASILNYLRFIIFFLISYFPIFLYLKKAKLINTDFYLFTNSVHLKYAIIIVFIPQILIFLFALDWGRYLNISLMLTYLFLLYLRSTGSVLNIKKFNFFNLKEKYNNLIIIIFCFSWYPKLLLWDDTGSLPLLRLLNRFKEITVKLLNLYIL